MNARTGWLSVYNGATVTSVHKSTEGMSGTIELEMQNWGDGAGPSSGCAGSLVAVMYSTRCKWMGGPFSWIHNPEAWTVRAILRRA